jgi:hypothetical protein
MSPQGDIIKVARHNYFRSIFDFTEVHSRHSGPGGQVAERLLDSDEAAALLGIHRDTGGFLKRLQSTLK